jgi:hypothetical protein
MDLLQSVGYGTDEGAWLQLGVGVNEGVSVRGTVNGQMPSPPRNGPHSVSNDVAVGWTSISSHCCRLSLDRGPLGLYYLPAFCVWGSFQLSPDWLVTSCSRA